MNSQLPEFTCYLPFAWCGQSSADCLVVNVPCVLLIFVVVPQIPLQPPLPSWNPCVLARSHNHELVDNELVRMPSAVCCLWRGPFGCCRRCCCCVLTCCWRLLSCWYCLRVVYTMLSSWRPELEITGSVCTQQKMSLKLVLFQDKVAVEQESNAPSTTPCLLHSGALRAALAGMTGALKPMRDQIMLDARHTRAYKCGRTLSSPT